MVLLYFLKWLQANQAEIQVDVLVLNGGDLENEFKKSCCTFYDFSQIVKPIKLKFWQRVLLKLGCFKKPNRKEKLLIHLSQNNYDIVYANTIVSIPTAVALKKKNPNNKLVVHVHEMRSVLELYRTSVIPFIELIDQFITVSNEANNDFINFTSVNEDKVAMVYEFSDRIVFKKNNEKTHFVVGGAGTTSLRKGTDLFIQLANLKKNNYANLPIKFIWVGAITGEFRLILNNELKKLGISDIIEFTDELESPETVFSTFDIFVLTSREDPFPLVCIEMGKLGIPIICFDKANGISEIILKGGGKVVPYLDTIAIMNNVEFYINNSDHYHKDCAINKNQFINFSALYQAPKILNSIKHLL
ncbi:glycosyltransferase [Mariniflexile sp. HMF6888]|uniref:glycosyltransferase n=1 Tax=Mariniflexile sp. HMF6888 TaxID=3373086 RepID=UPI0037B37799